MTILAGLSPVGALIVRAGEPKVLNISLAQADGTTPQNLEGRTFALIVRRSSRIAPLFTVPAELSGDGLYVSFMITAAQATAIYEAGYAQALSYDIVELSGGASTSRFTERVLVQTAPSLPSDIVPIWSMLPYTEAMIRPDALVITERGATGDGTPALEAAAQVAAAITELGEFTSERSAEIDGALTTVGEATASALGVVEAQAQNLATVADAVVVTGEDRLATQEAAQAAGTAATQAGDASVDATAAKDRAVEAEGTTLAAEGRVEALKDQVVAAVAVTPGNLQTNLATPTIPPAGVASGASYWAVTAVNLQLYTNNAGTGVIVPGATTPLSASIFAPQMTFDPFNEIIGANQALGQRQWWTAPAPNFSTASANIPRTTPVLIGTANVAQGRQDLVADMSVKVGETLTVAFETYFANAGGRVYVSWRDGVGAVVGSDATSALLGAGLSVNTLQTVVPAGAVTLLRRITPPATGAWEWGFTGHSVGIIPPALGRGPIPRTLAALVAGLDAGAPNVFSDPFGEALLDRPMGEFRTVLSYSAGTVNKVSANSPWGKPSLAVAGNANNVNRTLRIGDLGLKAADTFTPRVLAYFTGANGSVTLFFRTAAGATIGSSVAITALAMGLNDVQFPPQVVPATCDRFEVRVAGGTDKELLALALAQGASKPVYAYGGASLSVRNQVVTQKNLWPDPFLRQHAAGVEFHDGWTFAQLAGVANPPIVTTNVASVHPGKRVIQFPTGAVGTRDINIDAKRLGLRANDKLTFVFDVYSAQAVSLSAFARDAANAVVGSISTSVYTYLAAGNQALRYTLDITQAMVDSAAIYQIRFFTAGTTIGATPVEIWARGAFVNDTQPILYDDCYNDDMINIQRRREATIGRDRLRECHKRLMERQLGVSTQCVFAEIGDSYTHLPARISGPLATYLQGKYGDAGYGFVGFGNPDSGIGNINGTAWKGLTITTVGTWVSNYATGFGPDICQVSATGAANIYKVNNIAASAGLAMTVLGQVVPGASYDYSFDAGVTWATIDASTGTDVNLGVLAGMPTSGTFSLWLRPNAGTPIFYGVNIINSAPGVVVHKLGATGSSAAQWAARVVDPKWQAAIKALNPNTVRIMLCVNDQTSSTNPNTVAGYIRTIVSTLQAILPGADILVIAPPENLRANNVKMAAYESVFRGLALETGIAYRNTQQDYGLKPTDYAAGSSRPWFNADLVHPDPANNGGYPIVRAEIGMYEA